MHLLSVVGTQWWSMLTLFVTLASAQWISGLISFSVLKTALFHSCGTDCLSGLQMGLVIEFHSYHFSNLPLAWKGSKWICKTHWPYALVYQAYGCCLLTRLIYVPSLLGRKACLLEYIIYPSTVRPLEWGREKIEDNILWVMLWALSHLVIMHKGLYWMCQANYLIYYKLIKRNRFRKVSLTSSN